MKKVNIRQALLDAIDQTDASLLRYEGQMMKWAKYVEKNVGSLNAYPRFAKKYNVSGSIIELEDDCLQVLKVVVGDFQDDINVYYRTWNDNLINVTTQTGYLDGRDIDYIWKSLDAIYVDEMLWEQVGNQLNLLSSYTDQDITVVYTTLEKNDQGYYIVNDSHIDAITKYIIYMFSKKELWKYFKSEKMMRANSIAFSQDLRRDYSIAMRNARAQDGTETPFETEQY